MMPDWTNGALEHSFYVVQLDPNNLSSERGQLDYVKPDGTLTMKYYGDTRVGLALTTVAPMGESDGWDGTAALRLVHECEGYTEVLFTGFVTNRTWSDESGIRTYEYELNSTLYGMESETAAAAYTVGKNAMALTVLKSLFNKVSRQYTISPLAGDYRFGSATVYDSDKSTLSIAYDICDRADDRLGVDGYGNVTVKPYTVPSARTPDIYLDTADSNAVTMPPVSGSDDSFEVPGRVVVSAKQDDKEVIGTASVGSTSKFTRGRRGYLLDKYYSETDLTPFTVARANEKAQTYLKQNTDVTEEIELSIMYRPLQEGEVVNLTHNGTVANYLISTASLDLSTWTWKLSLKKVSE